MAYLVKLRKYDAKGPEYGRFGPFATQELAHETAQNLADQTAEGMVVTIEAERKKRRKKPAAVTAAAPAKANPRSTITRSQIHAFAAEAASAGDREGHFLAEKALRGNKTAMAQVKRLIREAQAYAKARKNPNSGHVYVCENDVYCPDRTLFSSLKEFKQMCKYSFGDEPVLTFRNGAYYDERGRLVLTPVARGSVKKNPGMGAAVKVGKRIAAGAAAKAAPHAKRAAANALELAAKKLRSNRGKR